MQGRTYVATFNNVAISAAQDLFSLANGASHIMALNRITLGQIGQTAVANIRLRVYRLTSPTVGSGGATVAGNALVGGDAAASCSVRANDTTQATGAATIPVHGEVWNTPGGFVWIPTNVNRAPVSQVSQLFVCSLDAAPSPTLSGVNGTIEWEEVG